MSSTPPRKTSGELPTKGTANPPHGSAQSLASKQSNPVEKSGSDQSAKAPPPAAAPPPTRTSTSPFDFVEEKEDPYYAKCQEPDFIYGGPFIDVRKPEPFIDTATPINIQLQGTFKKSYAYYSLKERMPVLLTKIIDTVSRDGSNIKSKHSSGDTQNFVRYIAKLKNDIVTNKKYDLLTHVETEEAEKWNEYIEACDQPHYFTNNWCFTECYIYRRIREGCEICGLSAWDPFEQQKHDSFHDNLEPMCIVAEKLQSMLEPSEKDKRKADFVTLLKICLWSNKCDLSLTLGEPVTMPSPSPPPSPPPPGGKAAPPALKEGKSATDLRKSKEDLTKSVTIVEEKPPPPPVAVDPFQLIIEYKDKLLVDDTNKIADQIPAKAEKIQATIEGMSTATFKCKCSCHRLAKVQKTRICMDEEQLEAARIAAALAAESKGKKGKGKPPPPPPPPPPEEGDEPPPPPVPCPAKVTVPSSVQFDIVCDNAGYELFTDLCLAHFLIAQKIVEKVRFHVKAIPWFVSDVTPSDFTYVIDSCASASYNRTVPAPEPKPVAEGEEPPELEAPRDINSNALKPLAEQWKKFVEDGTFVVMSEDYWTSPHTYKDMKRYDYWLYRKLQMACGVLFKGDLNYRKLVGERCCNPYAGFEPSLQGFLPAPIIALRTVKSDTVCGLPRGKFDAINKIDAMWMRKGDYGVIQFCAKAEPLKIADRPCSFYCGECMGLTCPEEGAFW